ncbi:glutathione S-transferase family protein [Polaromonas jejuensis]|uniref:Glutathione S-transferase family protein n=1 Tax=Polaromonas jejuensis TaxID=457502 RepID=A0ABW0Q8A1_9BURK|nr:glutathione S-transferase family protein [Polaromonas jejuensis]
MLKLYIGNKNYSSWSMRPWVLLKQAGIPFEEVKLRFDSFDANSSFKEKIGRVSPAGKVPALDDGGFVVWDSLAIAEYLAERFPGKNLWPQSVPARARARSVCAEMHSGFGALRSACPMNIEADLQEAGQLIWRDKPAVRADVQRLVAMWSELLAEHQGPRTAADAPSGDRETKSTGGARFLFGDFSIADAFFAPVCMRLKSYALPVPAEITAYIQRLNALPGVKAWVDDALAENDFRDFEEPYRIKR